MCPPGTSLDPVTMSRRNEMAAPRSAWALCLLAAIGLLAAVIRLRLLDVPLDRDEGEYAYFGQLLLAGVPPYADAYNLKAPGIYAAYALILGAFGQTITAIRVGLIIVTSATTVLMYLFAARLGGPRTGLVAAAVYAVQALNPKVLGLAAYAEHFVLLSVVAGSLVLMAPARDRRPLLVATGGLLFGLAVLMKQSAAPFVVAGALYTLLSRAADGTGRWPRRLRATAFFAAGAVTPFALACLALWYAGTLRTFLFWALVYGSTYSTGLSTGLINLVGRFIAVAPSSSVTLGLGAIGLAPGAEPRVQFPGGAPSSGWGPAGRGSTHRPRRTRPERRSTREWKNRPDQRVPRWCPENHDRAGTRHGAGARGGRAPRP